MPAGSALLIGGGRPRGRLAAPSSGQGTVKALRPAPREGTELSPATGGGAVCEIGDTRAELAEITGQESGRRQRCRSD